MFNCPACADDERVYGFGGGRAGLPPHVDTRKQISGGVRLDDGIPLA